MKIELLTSTIPAPHGPPRTEGIHVSTVIRHIGVLNKTLKPEYVESLELVDRQQSDWWAGLTPVNQLRMSMGLAWESYYLGHLLQDVVVHQPGEMCLEGIYMTHDGESLETIVTVSGPQTVLAVHEVKLTYKSWNTIRDIANQWLWIAQMMAYCKGLGTTLAFAHVLCVCGDYRRPIEPRLDTFRIEFTQEEIDEFWTMLTGYVQLIQQGLLET